MLNNQRTIAWGYCRSSVDSSTPSIMPPWVRVPRKTSTLLTLIVKFVLCLSCEKNENKRKRGQVCPICKANNEQSKCTNTMIPTLARKISEGLQQSVHCTAPTIQPWIIWMDKSRSYIKVQQHGYVCAIMAYANDERHWRTVATYKNTSGEGGSTGLVIMGRDSCPEGRGFESQHCIPYMD